MEKLVMVADEPPPKGGASSVAGVLGGLQGRLRRRWLVMVMVLAIPAEW